MVLVTILQPALRVHVLCAQSWVRLRQLVTLKSGSSSWTEIHLHEVLHALSHRLPPHYVRLDT